MFGPSVAAGIIKQSDLAGYRTGPVYIHPYFDGNGRMGRFIMNLMMAAGGYSWTVVPVDTVKRRTEYMEALETASVEQNIAPFTKFLASLLF